MRANPAGLNGAPRSEVNTNADFGSCSRSSRRKARVASQRGQGDLIELSTTNAQRQLTTLTEQTKELGELAQQATLAAVEPLKTGITKAFGD